MAASAGKPRQKRFAFIMIDGLGDSTLPSLNYCTPLQAADTPNLDALAACGINGLMDPVEPGLACGSDTAHMNIFGYDPRKWYRGRGAFETMGAGLSMVPGDIAFKSNFATLDRTSNVVTSRRADRNFESLGPPLCAVISSLKLPSFPEHEVACMYATEHRCGVRVRGPGLSDAIVGTDPLKDNLPLCVAVSKDGKPDSIMTAKLVNELSTLISDTLEAHPINEERKSQGKGLANCVLLRGCGACIDVTPFHKLHGIPGFVVAPTAIIAGLAMSIGLDVVRVPGATGDYHTDLEAKGRGFVRALTEGHDKKVEGDEAVDDKNPGKNTGDRQMYSFGFCHIKAVDDAGHDKNVKLKVEFLTRIDKMIGDVVSSLAAHGEKNNIDYYIGCTGDHSTVAEYGDHTPEPVPFTIASVATITARHAGPSPAPGAPNAVAAGLSIDSVCKFDEISVARGGLGRFTGSDFMTLIKRCVC